MLATAPISGTSTVDFFPWTSKKDKDEFLTKLFKSIVLHFTNEPEMKSWAAKLP